MPQDTLIKIYDSASSSYKAFHPKTKTSQIVDLDQKVPFFEDGTNKIKLENLPDAAIAGMRYAGILPGTGFPTGTVLVGEYFIVNSNRNLTAGTGNHVRNDSGTITTSGNTAVQSGDWVVLESIHPDTLLKVWAIINNNQTNVYMPFTGGTFTNDVMMARNGTSGTISRSLKFRVGTTSDDEVYLRGNNQNLQVSEDGISWSLLYSDANFSRPGSTNVQYQASPSTAKFAWAPKDVQDYATSLLNRNVNYTHQHNGSQVFIGGAHGNLGISAGNNLDTGLGAINTKVGTMDTAILARNRIGVGTSEPHANPVAGDLWFDTTP